MALVAKLQQPAVVDAAIDVAEFLVMTQRAGCSIVDVRSPSEYLQGHIPGASNVCLFTDEDRAVVGTAYKHEGRQRAVELGMAVVGPKMVDIVSQVRNIVELHVSKNRTVVVHCWRGGMRSRAVAWLLTMHGMDCRVLRGGYKAWRTWIRSSCWNGLSLTWTPPTLPKERTGSDGGEAEMSGEGAERVDLDDGACQKTSAAHAEVDPASDSPADIEHPRKDADWQDQNDPSTSRQHVVRESAETPNESASKRAEEAPEGFPPGLSLYRAVLEPQFCASLVRVVQEQLERGRQGMLLGGTYAHMSPCEHTPETLRFGTCTHSFGVLSAPVLPLPTEFQKLVDILVARGAFSPSSRPSACTVNVFEVGQFLRPHVDSWKFVRPIVTVSLLSEQAVLFGKGLRYEKVHAGETTHTFTGGMSICMPIASALRLTGEAANKYKHGIPPVSARRISLTFRCLAPGIQKQLQERGPGGPTKSIAAVNALPTQPLTKAFKKARHKANRKLYKASVRSGGQQPVRVWPPAPSPELVEAMRRLDGPRVCIIGGRTGVGKTRLLLALRAMGGSIVDLEGLANHRGSAFGWCGQDDVQPTTEHFRNLVAMQWARATLRRKAVRKKRGMGRTRLTRCRPRTGARKFVSSKPSKATARRGASWLSRKGVRGEISNRRAARCALRFGQPASNRKGKAANKRKPRARDAQRRCRQNCSHKGTWKQRWIFVEDEDLRVGDCLLPEGMYAAMRCAPLVIRVVISLEARVNILVEDYGSGAVMSGDREQWKSRMQASIRRLTKRVGPAQTKALEDQLVAGDYPGLATGLLQQYYDKLYDRHITNAGGTGACENAGRVGVIRSVGGSDAVFNASELAFAVLRHVKQFEEENKTPKIARTCARKKAAKRSPAWGRTLSSAELW